MPNTSVTDETPAEWTVLHFSQSNPHGPGQGNVPALLRRVADTIDGLGRVWVQDITFKTEPTGEDEFQVAMTVYYHKVDEDSVLR